MLARSSGISSSETRAVVAQPLVEGKPAVRVLQREAVGVGRFHRSCAVPAQEPVLAVGEYAGADALAFICGEREVVVDLLHILRVGVEACLHVADPALDFDECVERSQVNGAAGCVVTAGFPRLDFTGLGELRFDEEIAYGAGDVGFRLHCRFRGGAGWRRRAA